MIFTEDQIQMAWSRATVVEGFDRNRYRKDACGAWIMRNKYGDIDSMYGWVIDHIVPQSLLKELGFDEKMINNPLNLRALQHANNMSKSDDYPSYTAVVTSEGVENVKVMTFLEVNKKKQDILKKLYNF